MRPLSRPVIVLALVLLAFGATAAGRYPQALAARGGQGAAADRRPNVLFISVDDLNDWVGVMGGYPGVKTPSIDRLSRRGVLFTNAHAAAPACNPSRTALLTGRRPSTTGVYTNDQPWRPVLRDVITLPEHFRENGYSVAGGGKIFHYNDGKVWDTYFDRPRDPVPPVRPANGIPKTAHFDWSPIRVPDEAMSDWSVTDWAVDYLEQAHQRPFFLAVGLFRPHLPWYVPQKYFDQYPLSEVRRPPVNPRDLDDVPAAGRRMARPEGDHRSVVETENWDRAIQGYLASITFADVCIGRLLDALDRSPHAQNTIIVLWGDHGWHLGEKEHWRKFTLWERASRMPLIVAAPGSTPAGASTDQPVSLVDLYPTLVELCGLSSRPGLDGESLVPLLRDPGLSRERPAVITHGKDNHAVRSERWRYIRYSDGAEELYDHDADPLEWHNLAGDPKLATVKSELAAWIPKTSAEDAPRQERRRGNPDAE